MMEPIATPSKWELVKVIRQWVLERCGIQYANLPNLDRLNIEDLRLIFLAIGYKLDQRVMANMERQFQWEWERIHGKRATIVPDAAITYEGDK